MKNNKLFALLVFLSCFLQTLFAQDQGKLIQRSIHSHHLEQSLSNESADRNISIYLPPSYETDNSKRYPVIFLLHGIGGTNKDWFLPGLGGEKFTDIKEVMDYGIKEGVFGEMIIVMPDQNTHWFGSFYTNSPVTGNWEDFTTEELVAYVDENFRTLAKKESRGIAGHSMGGYGALSLAIRHPDIYSLVYGLSPAIIEFTADLASDQEFYRKVLRAKSFDELRQTNDFLAMGAVTVAQAFSPNIERPPFYVDMPFKEIDGKLSPNYPAYNKWLEKSPIRMIESYRENFDLLKGIGFDVGDQDEFSFILLNSQTFSKSLHEAGIDHFFEVYSGDHRNQLMGEKGRFYKKLLPFFSKRLEFQ
ncbi:MAG: alpha/beta hydrolase-fold protein [Bacteroidia bacterium]|nr:alpha/beta hydrolase-fold protein [Bacteroidia bacterium]